MQTLGLNIGSEIYLSGKQNKDLIGIKITKVGSVVVTSPRTGIIEIGSGSFSSHPSANYAQIFLMSVMFHEARHSDGHGKTAAFTHATCPEGHAYAGYSACDNNANGPYSVQANLIHDVVKNCTSCTAGQLEFLSGFEADSLSRVVPVRSEQGTLIQPGYWDDRPEGHR